MKMISKNCPNCGAEIKFNIGDYMTMCDYCSSQINIDWGKTSNNYQKNQKIIQMNQNWEIFKLIFFSIHSALIIILAIVFLNCSELSYSLVLLLGGVLSFPIISKFIFREKRILQFITIELLIVIGFVGGILNVYPIEIKHKFYSESLNMSVQIKGNYIIMEQEGEKTKERYKCEKTLSMYGITYYEITTSKYKFKYRHKEKDKDGVEDQFYLVDKYGDEIEELYIINKNNSLNYINMQYNANI